MAYAQYYSLHVRNDNDARIVEQRSGIEFTNAVLVGHNVFHINRIGCSGRSKWHKRRRKKFTLFRQLPVSMLNQRPSSSSFTAHSFIFIEVEWNEMAKIIEQNVYVQDEQRNCRKNAIVVSVAHIRFGFTLELWGIWLNRRGRNNKKEKAKKCKIMTWSHDMMCCVYYARLHEILGHKEAYRHYGFFVFFFLLRIRRLPGL